MARDSRRPLEAALIALTSMALALGVAWAPQTPAAAVLEQRPAATPGGPRAGPTGIPVPAGFPTPIPAAPTPLPTADPRKALTAEKLNQDIKIEAGDAPLIKQAAGTINVLLMGIDITLDRRLARTDTVMVASINPEVPSVSLLSIPRDLQVRIPGRSEDRINTVSEYGYLSDYPGGGPSFLAAVLRKNFGIKIDHYARIDLNGFMKAIDALGGIDVLVECEIKDTFFTVKGPDGKIISGVQPGLVRMSAAQANFYARSRYSTTDFDRARRQQRILKAIASKAKSGNIFNNLPALIGTIQENFDTDLSLIDAPYFIDLARRMDNLAIKQRVVTYPVVESYLRRDGAQVLRPTKDTIPYIVESLEPPQAVPGNKNLNRPTLEIVNASGRKDMELLAAERMGVEGFNVVKISRADVVKPRTQIIDLQATPKGTAATFLVQFFALQAADVLSQPSAGAASQIRLVLGEDYESCPNTSNAARERQTLPGNVDIAPTRAP
ncbi:MAG TPA: LCP family protein [Thermoflexales bacterium]|nr:LCP family protein [Thermoflexales bacterium]